MHVAASLVTDKYTDTHTYKLTTITLAHAVHASRVKNPYAVVTPVVPNTYKPCRSRNCIRGHIPMYAIFAVFYLLSVFLPVLSRPSFTSRTPNKDQKIEQVFYFLLIQVP